MKARLQDGLRVKIWGARGSLPSPLAPSALRQHIRELLREFLTEFSGKSLPSLMELDAFLCGRPFHTYGGYGGNTSCIEVSSNTSQIIIDGGSGIRPLGYELLEGPCGRGAGEVHILFTHFHWDHVNGLTFFTPLFIPGNKIHVYSVQPELQEVFQTLFRKPMFPVPLEQLDAKIIYHRLDPRKPKLFGDITVTPYQLDHPDPCWGFKIHKGEHVYAHCVDTECLRTTREEMGPDLPLYQGVDTMLFDAQYTLVESIEKVNWGHASASVGLDIAMRENIRRVIFVHHDPASSNAKIAAAERQARTYYNGQIKRARHSEPYLHQVEWEFGYEGMILEV